MLKKIAGLVSATAASTILLCLPSIASADEIALTFADHEITITGQLASFEGSHYVVMTHMGLISVPAAMVSCAGADCPDVVSATQANG